MKVTNRISEYFLTTQSWNHVNLWSKALLSQRRSKIDGQIYLDRLFNRLGEYRDWKDPILILIIETKPGDCTFISEEDPAAESLEDIASQTADPRAYKPSEERHSWSAAQEFSNRSPGQLSEDKVVIRQIATFVHRVRSDNDELRSKVDEATATC